MVTTFVQASGYVASLSDLPLEYERDYGTARRDGEIPNIFDNPVIFSPRRIDSGLGTEQLGDDFLADFGAARDDLSHSLLISKEAV